MLLCTDVNVVLLLLTTAWNLLTAYGSRLTKEYSSGDTAFDFVGSRYHLGDHQGHSGARIVRILEELQSTRSLALYVPDIVLLLAGTNDFGLKQDQGERTGGVGGVRRRCVGGYLMSQILCNKCRNGRRTCAAANIDRAWPYCCLLLLTAAYCCLLLF